ncbi:MAG TPA: TlpA family protein disulfide reductase, partial [Firmicutes bacterium]|nr:TlpA family protein disulfide reductase [Bacillota bacterium]
DIDGGKIKPFKNKKKTTIINVFDSTCRYCTRQTAELHKLIESYSEELSVIGASLSSEAGTRHYMSENNIDFPVFITSRERLTEDFGPVSAVPTTYVLDKKGRIYSRYHAFIPSIVLETDIRAILAEK